MSFIKTFKDKLGNIVYPATHAKAVFVEKDGSAMDLQQYLNNVPQMNSSGKIAYDELPTPVVDSNPTSAQIASYPDGAIWIEE